MHARELGLPVAEKPDSQEICFVPDGDHAAFLERQVSDMPTARFATSTASVVGTHDGVHHFTIGQRKGLGLSAPVRLYVVGIDAESQNRDGRSRAALGGRRSRRREVNWIAGVRPAAGGRVTAQIRYRHREAAARSSRDPTTRSTSPSTSRNMRSRQGRPWCSIRERSFSAGGWID